MTSQTPRILIRADAGETIGGGHLMRCLALAEGLRERGAAPVFVTRTRHPRYLAAVERRGLPVMALAEGLPAEDEPAALARLRQGGSVAGLMVDRYGLPTDYFLRIRALEPDWVLAHMDDLGRDLDGIDLIVNQNIGADEGSYQDASARGVVVLTGPRYALLRSEFRTRPRGRSPGRDGVSKILITLGGSDPENHTQRILQALDGLDPRAEFHVVLGPGFSHRAAVTAFAARRSRIRISADVPDMYQLMRDMDLSINGSGSTLWELYYVGLPTIVYALADNQLPIAKRAHALGASRSLGPIETFEARTLRDTVQELIAAPEARRRMAERARKLVDGGGVDRVATALLSLCATAIGALSEDR